MFLIIVSIMSAASVVLLFPGITGRMRHKALEYWSKLLELIDGTQFRDVANQQRIPEKFSKIKSRLLHQTVSDRSKESSTPIDMRTLNCHYFIWVLHRQSEKSW